MELNKGQQWNLIRVPQKPILGSWQCDVAKGGSAHGSQRNDERWWKIGLADKSDWSHSC